MKMFVLQINNNVINFNCPSFITFMSNKNALNIVNIEISLFLENCILLEHWRYNKTVYR